MSDNNPLYDAAGDLIEYLSICREYAETKMSEVGQDDTESKAKHHFAITRMDAIMVLMMDLSTYLTEEAEAETDTE